MKSFYEILEVAQSATSEEIRSAYLRLAREYHPDRVPEHLTKLRADAEEKFKQVQEAWTTLGDPSKRRSYDFRAKAENSPRPVATATKPPSPAKAPTNGIVDFLRRKQDLLRWVTIVLLVMFVLILVAGLLISREAVSRLSTLNGIAVPGPRVSGIIARQYKSKPRHIETWRPAGGRGLDVELISLTLQPEYTELSFRAQAGERTDLLLYEPPTARQRVRLLLGKEVMPDRQFEEIFIQDSKGAKFYSTTGLIGGSQADFTVYNFTRRINFRPGEAVTLSARFPSLPTSASTITFVSPAIGQWQPEWWWPDIALK